MEGVWGISERGILYWRDRVGVGVMSPPMLQATLTVVQQNIGTAQDDSYGILLINPQSAYAGKQQDSPPLVFSGQGWATTSGTSRDVRFRFDVLPAQGTTNPTATLQIAYSVNGGSYSVFYTLTSAGVFSTGGSIIGGGGLTFTGNNVAVASGTTQINFAGSTTAQNYRTTNGGADLNAMIHGANSTVTAGTLGFGMDNTNSIFLLHANGTRFIAGAALQLANLVNTAGSESSDLIFLTQAGGAAMAEAFRIVSTKDIQLQSTITKYNNISTVSNGVPSELATVDLTAQTAATAKVNMYTPAGLGMFRISVYLQVTTAASTSSVLGGAAGVIITWNDGDGNVAQSNTMALQSPAGAIVTTSATNTTTTNLCGEMIIYARAGVAITYQVDYTSVGITAMQYSFHAKVEAL